MYSTAIVFFFFSFGADAAAFSDGIISILSFRLLGFVYLWKVRSYM